MNWMTQLLTREGPGMPRNAPRKEGLALLAGVVAREWRELVQLNLLYVLFCLPVVTAPAAHVAATRVCLGMIDDRNVYLMRDFWETFRARFGRATAFGFMAGGTALLAGYAAFVFVQAARAHLGFALPLTVSLAVAVFAVIAAMHGAVLLARADMPLARLVRLSLLGALAAPLPALAALGFTGALWLAHIAFYPASVFMPAVLNFSFGTLAMTFGVHKAAARLLTPGTGAQPAGADAGSTAQPRVQQREGKLQ